MNRIIDLLNRLLHALLVDISNRHPPIGCREAQRQCLADATGTTGDKYTFLWMSSEKILHDSSQEIGEQ